MNKKGQGLSINLIIVAAIALVVLVIIILLFAGKIRLFGESGDTCMARNGVCMNRNDCDEASEGRILETFADNDEAARRGCPQVRSYLNDNPPVCCAVNFVS